MAAELLLLTLYAARNVHGGLKDGQLSKCENFGRGGGAWTNDVCREIEGNGSRQRVEAAKGSG